MDKITVTEEELFNAIDVCILQVIADVVSDERLREHPREQVIITETCTLVRKGLERYELWQTLKKHTQD